MAAERPRRRITQPCLEYNGGLLHKEEVMLRKAMYASLNESKKPSPSKLANHHSITSEETSVSNGSQCSTTVDSKPEDRRTCVLSITPCEFDNNNGGSELGKSSDVNHSALKDCPEMKKKIKGSKEPSKLLNYVIKKKKEKRTSSRALLRTLSPTKLSGSSETGFSTSLNEKSKKKKKRQRGALAVFVAMNKSAGGKIHKNHFSGSDKELLLKAKKKRRRKRKVLNNEVFSKTNGTGIASEELPAKKSRKDDKKLVRMVQAQRKFAKKHPLSPSSMKVQEERNLSSSSFARAKTEDFLTFLCLRNNPVLPKELEIFNNPCLPMSPLSDDQEDNSCPPSPTQSQSSMSNLSNPSSTIQKSFSDSPAPSVDSPAMGEGPSWESGVVRMYADGPQGLAGNGNELKKYDELQPSDEADDPRDLTKSVTPPLAFRVSSRPTTWTGCKFKDKQLPRPIPKPFAVKPSLTGNTTSRTSFSPTVAVNTRNDATPPPPPLLHPTESASCSPPPPPLLYIPAAAQRVTHLHGPPTLQRFPSTSPTREQESGERLDQQKLSIDRNAGPPPLKRFPPVVVENETTQKGQDSDGNSSNELFSTRSSSPDIRSFSSSSSRKDEPKTVSPSATNTALGRSSSSLSDLTKISQLERETGGTGCRWKNKEMPLLRRHSSASQHSVDYEDRVNLPEGSSSIKSRSSPPQLHRVSVTADTGQLELSKTPAGPSEISGDRLETSGSRLISSCNRMETSDTRREISEVPVKASSVGSGSPGFPLEAFGDRTKTSVCRLETGGSGFQTSGDRRHTSGSPFDTSCSRLSPNLPLLPPRLVRHSPTSQGHPDVSLTSHHNNRPISGNSPQLRASPLALSTHRNSPQTFHENNYPRPIPVAGAVAADGRPSPLLLSTKDKHKSTYVFSNRQSYLLPGNEPRPLQVSSLVMPSNYNVNLASNRAEGHSRGFQAVDDFSRSDGRRSFEGNGLYSMQNQYVGSNSSSLVFRPHESFNEARRQFGDFLGSERIPSPRSDLFSRISHEPVNPSCMSRIGIPNAGSSSVGDQPMALRPAVRQKDNMLECFPPTWSHLESPYSVPSIAARNSLPKPYTFSPNLPPQASRHFQTQSVGSRSNSSTPALESYSLAAHHQHVPVIQSANLNKGESSDGMQLGLHAGEHKNLRTYHLPPAFQVGDSRHDSRTNATRSESTFSNTSAKECLMRESFLNGRNSADLNRKSLSPLLSHTEPPTRSPSLKSPSVNRDTPSPLLRHSELLANPPSSKSPSLKAKQSDVSEVAVASDVTRLKKSCNSSVMPGKKLPGSKQKQSLGPSSVFHPTEDEFKDPVSYIKMIRQEAERFGVCLIVPPESWKPEFQISDNVRFNSECQLIHRLQDRWGPVEEELACIKKHLDQQSILLTPMPQIGGYELDLPQFSRVVRQFGGLQKVIDSKKWTKVADTLKIPRAAQDRIGKLQDIYCKYLLSYDLVPQDEKAELLRQVQSEKQTKAEQGSESWSVKGRNLSLVPFQRLARNVQGHFFKNPPSANDVEREFWKIVHDRESYVSVHRGTLDTNQEHSCFPTDKGDPYSKLGWNLNVLPHLPGSVVRHLGFVQDITVPWLQFDMLFSVKPWQVHPLAFFTVDYLHSGAEKIWYSVPGGEKNNLECLLQQEDVKTTETSPTDKMVSPSSLSDKGVAVTRIVQKQGHFVIVSPEAYHSTISCGYSISEAVAFAPPDWLVVGSKRYKELQDPSWLNEFTYDRLLVGIAQELSDETQEVVQCLLEELKHIRDEEKLFMTELLELGLVETVDKEEKSTGSSVKKSKKSLTSWSQADSSCVLYCEECDRPCYLSAVTGENEPQVLCLKHAVDHIRARASPNGFRILNRYDTAHLDELVNKVEDRLKKAPST